MGQRSLLDVLNTQNALFQTSTNLVNARSLETFVKYRVLASAGVLLPTMGIEAPEDAKVYAREEIGVQPVRDADTRVRRDAKTFSDWRKTLDR